MTGREIEQIWKGIMCDKSAITSNDRSSMLRLLSSQEANTVK